MLLARLESRGPMKMASARAHQVKRYLTLFGVPKGQIEINGLKYTLPLSKQPQGTQSKMPVLNQRRVGVEVLTVDEQKRSVS